MFIQCFSKEFNDCAATIPQGLLMLLCITEREFLNHSDNSHSPALDMNITRPRLIDWLCSVLRPRPRQRSQHSIGYGRRFLQNYRSKDPTNGIKVLKERLDQECSISRERCMVSHLSQPRSSKNIRFYTPSSYKTSVRWHNLEFGLRFICSYIPSPLSCGLSAASAIILVSWYNIVTVHPSVQLRYSGSVRCLSSVHHTSVNITKYSTI